MVEAFLDPRRNDRDECNLLRHASWRHVSEVLCVVFRDLAHSVCNVFRLGRGFRMTVEPGTEAESVCYVNLAKARRRR